MTNPAPSSRPPIAIVGVSALFPGSHDASGFWRDIRAGADLLGEVPSSHWLIEDYYDPDPKAPDKTYARRGGFLSPVDFDPIAWGVPPKILRATDTTQLLALMVAEQVLRDAAGARFATMDRSAISVILGVTSAQELISTMVSRLQRPVWVKALREHGVPEDEVVQICERIADHYVPWEESSFPGLLGNVVAGRIANRLDLGGTNCVTDAACASTFAALSMALQELWLGDSQMVITGGADTLNDIFMFMCFSKTPALSQRGDCRPFSDAADGTMLGEGLGMVALRRLADAERDGDPIYAVIRGIGSSSDGRSKSVYAPVSTGQALALRRAYDQAGVEPGTVELIEAHGTGTKAGDAAEFEGLKLAFEGEGARQFCALGSVKSQIGHTKAAAGAAGLFKAAMALHHQVLPPTVKVERPNPALDIERSPFYLNTQARPWIRGSSHPRRAGVSAFGFGGSNFHVVLEEYRGEGRRAGRLRAMAGELVVLAGQSGAEVAAAARRWAARGDEAGILEWAACASQASFEVQAPARLAVVALDGPDLRAKLERAAAQIEATPEQPFDAPDGTSYGLGPREGGLALLFPGQGSQYVAMGAELAMNFEAARAAWDLAADLDFGDGRRLHELVFPVPRFSAQGRERDELALRATQWAQPAIGCASLAMLALLEQLGVEFDAVAGHSFGEVAALHAAGVIGARDLLRVARRRGELMAAAGQDEVCAGAMSAVVASAAAVEEVLAAAGLEGVVLANLNAPKQTVISGTAAAIEGAELALAGAGLACTRLPVAAAFHSPLVAASVEPFAAFLDDVSFEAGRVPVYSGESGAPYEADAQAQRARLARQIARPVGFVSVIESMAEAGVRTFVEVGPRAVLTGLVDRILADREHLAIALDRRGQDGVLSLLRALAKLAARGVAIDYEALWDGYRGPVDPAARPRPKLAVPISGTNYGKPYPPPGGAAELPPPNPARPPSRPEHEPDMSDRPSPAPEQPPSYTPPNGPSFAGVASSPAMPSPPTGGGVAATPSPPPATGAGWLGAWQEAQRQTAETHALVQQAMASAHAAYLQTTQVGLAQLAAMAGVQPQAMPQMQTMSSATMSSAAAQTMGPMASAAPQTVSPMTPAAAQTVSPMAPAAPQTMSPMTPAAAQTVSPMAPAPHVPTQPMAAAQVDSQPSLAPSPLTPAPAAAPAVDLEALMLEAVADKTGYPAQMLELSMDMEAELGIDSIKRVEILAAVQEQAPGLPEVDATHMGTLRTLGEIVEYMSSLLDGVPAPPEQASSACAAAPAVDLEALMLEVVADKTGYPAQMLELSMDMEAELGIDSIKRVEILAAVQEQAPGLPEVDATHMGTLRTLGEIVDYMSSLLTGADTSSSVEPASEPPAESLPAIEGPPLGRYALELVDAPSLGFARAGLHAPGGVVVTDEGSGVAAALVDELHRRGVEARVVSEVPADAGAVVFLGGLREVESEEAALAVNRELLHAARAVGAGRVEERGGLFVSVQDSGGGFGLEPCPRGRALLAGLPALIKTAKQEWPTASLVAIDLERGGRSPAALAGALADELLRGGGEIEVALAADGRRRTLRSFASPIPELQAESPTKIGAGEVVVVSGGARGVTAACMIEWARRAQPRLVLLGRTSLEDEPAECVGIEDDAGLKRALLERARRSGQTPSPVELARAAGRILAGREIRATLAAIAEAGGEARYLSVDVTRPAAVTEALAEVRASWGPIVGLVHAAGVLADKRIAELDDERYERVFATKVAGARALLQATRDDSLRLLCMFSSVSARCGNNGQAAYAMANAVLEQVAHVEARARPQALVRALGWGPWEGGMVGPQLREHFARLGVPMIPLARGAEMFVDELGYASAPAGEPDPRQVAVVLGGEPRPEALRSAGSEARILELEIHVARDSHPYLADHQVGGAVVVPVVLVLEWCARIARAFRPDLALRGLAKLQVLRGIKLANFDAGGDRLRLRCRQLRNGEGATLAIELVGADGSPHYRAEALMAASPRALGRGPGFELGPLRDWGGAVVYGDVLFHGRRFQVIDALEGIADAGIAGTLHGVAVAGWRWEPWQTDVAALDGALQLAVLWAREQLGGASLPMAIGEVRLGEAPVGAGPLRAVVRCRKLGRSRALAEVALLDAEGVRLVELREVELVLRPDQPRVLERDRGPHPQLAGA